MVRFSKNVVFVKMVRFSKNVVFVKMVRFKNGLLFRSSQWCSPLKKQDQSLRVASKKMSNEQ